MAEEDRKEHHQGCEQTQQLATTFGRYKAFVPSRSHPAAGEHPPFETVMGLLTAPIDHVADLFRKFSSKTISPNPCHGQNVTVPDSLPKASCFDGK
jgi:hypothetical protein